MPYNEALDIRISEIVSGWRTVKKKMFGGSCHLLNGNMMFGVYQDFLILRLGNSSEEALKQPHVKPFDITGRPMAGWVMVEGAGFRGAALNQWLGKAMTYAATLPPKQ